MDPTLPTHLPRYKRAATKVNLILTERDLIILRLVESFRLLTSEHIQALAPGMVITSDELGRAMIRAARDRPPTHVLEMRDLQALARR